MWKAIKLALIYYLMQVLGALVMMPFVYGYLYVALGTVDEARASRIMMPLSMFAGMVFMLVYLWKKRHITKGDVQVPATGAQIGWTMLAGLGIIFLLDILTSYLKLPNLMEASFDVMQSGVLGILCISLLGPIMEELLFRGAIMKVLGKRFNPAWTIVISALIFGLIHINPIQVVAASFSGLLFGYVYYTTRSLWPCIVLHVFNNSMSVYFDLAHPEFESVIDVMSGTDLLFWSFVSAVALGFSVRMLWKQSKNQPIMEETV